MTTAFNIRITGLRGKVLEATQRLEMVLEVIHSTTKYDENSGLTHRDLKVELTDTEGWGISYRPGGFIGLSGNELPPGLVLGGPCGGVIIPLSQVQKLHNDVDAAAEELATIEKEAMLYVVPGS